MAGPLSSEEIEDVVSSVRRLVSNEHSSRSLSRDLNADKLLLTPALRVVSETSPLAPLILDGRLDERPVAEPMAPDEMQVLTADDDAVDLIEAEWEEQIWSGPEVVSLGEVALGAEDAEMLVHPTDAVVDVPTDALPQPQSAPDSAEADPIPFLHHRLRTVPIADRLDQLSDPAENHAGSSDITPDPAEAVALQGDAGQDEAVDDAQEAEMGPSAAESSGDAVEPSPDATRQRIATEILDTDGTALAVLDEAALQEVVRQMIREELQGDLGERITRNVRKLVRAEINRALMARDLD